MGMQNRTRSAKKQAETDRKCHGQPLLEEGVKLSNAGPIIRDFRCTRK